jgi:hypothetical protein
MPEPLPMPPMLHDLVIKRTKKRGRVKIEGSPPEEFLIARRSIDLDRDPLLLCRAAHPQDDLAVDRGRLRP